MQVSLSRSEVSFEPSHAHLNCLWLAFAHGSGVERVQHTSHGLQRLRYAPMTFYGIDYLSLVQTNVLFSKDEESHTRG